MISLSVTCDRSVISSTNKTDGHDITVILLKAALSTMTFTFIRYLWLHYYHLIDTSADGDLPVPKDIIPLGTQCFRNNIDY